MPYEQEEPLDPQAISRLAEEYLGTQRASESKPQTTPQPLSDTVLSQIGTILDNTIIIPPDLQTDDYSTSISESVMREIAEILRNNPLPEAPDNTSEVSLGKHNTRREPAELSPDERIAQLIYTGINNLMRPGRADQNPMVRTYDRKNQSPLLAMGVQTGEILSSTVQTDTFTTFIFDPESSKYIVNVKISQLTQDAAKQTRPVVDSTTINLILWPNGTYDGTLTRNGEPTPSFNNKSPKDHPSMRKALRMTQVAVAQCQKAG